MSAVGDPVEDLGNLWRWFGERSTKDYSPIYTDICLGVAGDREVLELVRRAPPSGHLPPLLLAAVHYLLLGGLDHPLGAIYESEKAPAPGEAAGAFHDLCLDHEPEILELLATRRVQTNEVGRSALIGPALTWAAARLPPPLRLLDVGASAGLNLLCDRYLLDYGTRGTTGDPDAPVRAECQVTKGDPPIAPRLPPLADRVGVDLDPPDLADPDDARWLLACVWPGTGRRERTRLAIDLAAEDPPRVLAGNALDLLPGLLAEPREGADVVVTTWSFSYVPPHERPRFVEILQRAGTRRPLVWIACDTDGVVDLVQPAQRADPAAGDVLSAVAFDAAGAAPTLLGYAHSHGVWLDWRG